MPSPKIPVSPELLAIRIKSTIAELEMIAAERTARHQPTGPIKNAIKHLGDYLKAIEKIPMGQWA